MDILRRRHFLNHYLGLLGAYQVIFTKFETDKVYGTVIYEPDNPEETQDFCWHMEEENVLSEEVIEIIDIIKTNNWIDIDKVIASWEEIFAKSSTEDIKKFMGSVDELLDVRVRMIDDGEETDTYFVHD